MALAFKTLRMSLFCSIKTQKCPPEVARFCPFIPLSVCAKTKHHMHKIHHYLLKCTSYLKALGYAALVNLTSSYS